MGDGSDTARKWYVRYLCLLIILHLQSALSIPTPFHRPICLFWTFLFARHWSSRNACAHLCEPSQQTHWRKTKGHHQGKSIIFLPFCLPYSEGIFSTSHILSQPNLLPAGLFFIALAFVMVPLAQRNSFELLVLGVIYFPTKIHPRPSSFKSLISHEGKLYFPQGFWTAEYLIA